MSVFCVALFLEIVFKGGSHRGCLHGGSFEVKTQTGVADGLSGGGSETSDTDVLLLESGEVFEKGVDTCGAEEEKHIIVKLLVGAEVIRNGTIHHSLRVLDAVLVEDACILLVDIRDDVKELLLLVLDKVGKKSIQLACLAMENLTLAIDDILLEIESD